MRLIFTILILWFLPGFAFLSALFYRKGEINFWQKFIYSFPFSAMLSSLIGLLLSRFYLLNLVWIIFSISLLTFGLFFIFFYRNFKNNLKINNGLFAEGIHLGLNQEIPVVIITVMSFFLLLSGIIFHPLPLAIDTAYISPAVEIAKQHGLPNYLNEWNGLQPISVDKVLFFIFTSETLILSKLDPLIAPRVMMLIGSFITILSAVCFFRIFFSSFVSSILVATLFFIPTFGINLSQKINRFCGEGFTYSLMFLLFWLGWHGFYLGESKKKFLAFILLPLISFFHAVVGLVCTLFLMSLTLSMTVFNFSKNRRIILYFLLMPVIFYFGGRLIVMGTGKKMEYSKIMTQEIKYQHIDGEDPTWLFFKLASHKEETRQIDEDGFYGDKEDLNASFILIAKYLSFFPSRLPSFIYSISLGAGNLDLGLLPDKYSDISNSIGAIGRHLNAIFKILFFIVKSKIISSLIFNILVIILLMTLLYIKLYKNFSYSFPILLTWSFFCIAVISLAYYFLATYSTYIPARHIFRREIRFLGFLPLFLWGFILILIRQKILQKNNLLFHITKVLALILIVVLCIFGHLKWHNSAWGLSKNGLKALVWLKNQIPQDKSILSNQWTHSSIALISQAKGVLDGRAPYLEPELLYSAISKFKAAHLFFITGEDKGLLFKEKVAYVLVAPQHSLGGNDITNSQYNLKLLDSNRNLKLIKIFGDVYIYEVAK
jgi:hypothetical protein